MKKKKWKGWDELSIQILNNGIKYGYSLKQLSEKINCSTNCIRTYCNRHNIKYKHQYKYWTSKDIQILKQYWIERYTVEYIAKKMDRTELSIFSQAYRLQLESRQRKKFSLDKQIKRLHKCGYLDWEISLRLDISENAIRKIRQRLQLKKNKPCDFI